MTTATKVSHIGRTDETTPTPGPTSAAWLDPVTVQRIAHPSIHPVAQPGCDLCPPTACRCGVADCKDVFDHSRTFAGAETTVWELSA